MGIADLGNVLKIFRGSDLSGEEKQELFQEVLLMVLARASSSDTAIQSIEVQTIEDIVERETGNSITEQDVRRAARTELYETTPLDKYLASASKKLLDRDRVAIVHLLAEVIKSDTDVSVLEIDFFNMVAGALQATPAEIAGLSGD
ncbi:MAG: TerB family tellurite resistance protein [Gammaproteobacteria bacterium]|nr:TerB family tellurite resistance protein [Gammaproteobacteria bacterium]